MSIFKFTNPVNGQPFEIKGPPTLTEAQARDIFQKQLDAGSLVGLKPGDVVSAATQAAAGLPAALSQIAQTASGIGASAQGALQGALTSTAGALTGAAGALGGAAGAAGAISGLAGQATSALTGALQSASALPSSVGSALDNVKSVATKAVSGISSAIASTPVVSGIGIADFAKQATALLPVGGLAVPDVTATLSQVNKLVGQTASQVSNALGVGKFGLDASQLETAGFVKPGVAASFLVAGTNALTDVLKSPTVWTGKDGIKSLTGLLDSVPAQDSIMQGLMATGSAALSQLGVPTDKLNPEALAGTLVNAAKSVPDTLKWATGQALPAGVKAAFDQNASASAFAVNFAEIKIPEPFKAETVPPVAENTVNRDTLNAAASRVTGNPKIPAVAYDSKPAKIDIFKYGTDVNAVTLRSVDLLAELQQLFKIPPSQTIAEFTAEKQRLEALQEKVITNQSELLTLESTGRAVKQQFGTNPQQSLIDRAKDRDKTILQLIEKVIKAVDGELARLASE
jgi:hypothetical protein